MPFGTTLPEAFIMERFRRSGNTDGIEGGQDPTPEGVKAELPEAGGGIADRHGKPGFLGTYLDGVFRPGQPETAAATGPAGRHQEHLGTETNDQATLTALVKTLGGLLGIGEESDEVGREKNIPGLRDRVVTMDERHGIAGRYIRGDRGRGEAGVHGEPWEWCQHPPY
jgi:hypothetical protein